MKRNQYKTLNLNFIQALDNPRSFRTTRVYLGASSSASSISFRQILLSFISEFNFGGELLFFPPPPPPPAPPLPPPLSSSSGATMKSMLSGIPRYPSTDPVEEPDTKTMAANLSNISRMPKLLAESKSGSESVVRTTCCSTLIKY